MLAWLIVGGGVHGTQTHLAHDLLHRRGVARRRLAMVDPHPEPLARWNRRTANVDMAYLRSPNVHHLGLEAERSGARVVVGEG